MSPFRFCCSKLQVRLSSHIKMDDGLFGTLHDDTRWGLVLELHASMRIYRMPWHSTCRDLYCRCGVVPVRGSGNGVESRRVLEDVIQLQSASASAASPAFTLPAASPPRQSEARKSPKAPSPGAGEIPSPSFPTKGRCAATYSFGPLTFAREEVPVLSSPPQPQQERWGFQEPKVKPVQ